MKSGKQHTLDVAAELVVEAFKKQLPRERFERVKHAGVLASDKLRWFTSTFSGRSDFTLFIGLSDFAQGALAPETTKSTANMQLIFEEFARILGATVGATISASAVLEQTPLEWAYTVCYELVPSTGPAGEVVVCLPESTIEALTRDLPLVRAADSAGTLDVLMNIDLPVTISFGSVELPLGDVLKLTTGSIVELNHRLNEPVDIVVNRCLVARGEVVVVDGNYGVRIWEVCRNAV